MARRVDLNSELGFGNTSSVLDSIQTINNAFLRSITTNYDVASALQEKYWDAERLAQKKSLEQQIKDSRTSKENREKAIKELNALEIRAKRDIAKQMQAIDAEIYKNATFLQKKQYAEKRKELIDAQKQEVELQIAAQKVISGANSDAVKKLRAAKKDLLKQEEKEKQLLEQIQAIEYKRSTLAEKSGILRDKANKKLEAWRDAQKNYDLAKASGASQKELSELATQRKEAFKEAERAGWQASLTEGLNKMVSKIGETVNAALNKIDQTMSTFFQYQGKINARLQGTGQTYQGMVRDVAGNIALSPYVSQKSMIENITKLVESGVAYNIEQRAFLASISENIAHTFDAFDGNLMRLIRLQQADSTAARLGMEAMITQVLNSRFSDTSYLNSTYDAVSQALIDTNSTLTRDQSLALEYTVQKWLGSLGSLGFSEGATSSIAQGLNLLGTGNVTALGSNSQLQTLLAMSASRANLPFADILTGGLTASTTNSLLLAMVQYLREISATNNQVVKAQYGQLFGLSMSDFRALQNLTESDIRAIAESTLDYGGAMKNLGTQMNQIKNRLSIAQMMDNIVDNAISGVAGSIGSNIGSYATWKITDIIEKATGGINIPAVYTVGTGVNLNATVTQLMKLGIAGANVLSLIGPIVSSFSNGFGLNLDAWGGTQYTPRGQGFVGVRNGVVTTISSSSYVASGSSTDMYRDTLAAQEERVKETQEIQSKEESNTKDIYQLMQDVIGSEGESYIRVMVINDTPIDVKFDSFNMPDNN